MKEAFLKVYSDELQNVALHMLGETMYFQVGNYSVS